MLKVWEPKLPHLTISVARLVYSAKWPVIKRQPIPHQRICWLELSLLV